MKFRGLLCALVLAFFLCSCTGQVPPSRTSELPLSALLSTEMGRLGSDCDLRTTRDLMASMTPLAHGTGSGLVSLVDGSGTVVTKFDNGRTERATRASNYLSLQVDSSAPRDFNDTTSPTLTEALDMMPGIDPALIKRSWLPFVRDCLRGV